MKTCETAKPDREHDVCIVSMSNLDTKDKDKKLINWKKINFSISIKLRLWEKNQQNQR